MMSDILLSDTHISVLVDTILQYMPGRSVIQYIVDYKMENHWNGWNREGTLVNELGGRLRQANGKSLHEYWRLRSNAMTDQDNYVYRPFVYVPHANYSILGVRNAAKCYGYYSCVVKDWQTSPTREIIEMLKRKLWTSLTKEEQIQSACGGDAVEDYSAWIIEDA